MKQEDNLECPPSPSALFPVGSALPLSTAGCVTGESGGSPCVHFLSAQRMAGTQGATEPCFLSSCGCKGPHTCMTSASLTEPAPQALPHTLFYSEKCFLILPLPSLPLFDFVCFCFVNGFFSVFFNFVCLYVRDMSTGPLEAKGIRSPRNGLNSG